MDETQITDSPDALSEPSGENQLQGQTLHIPKTEDYSVPKQGSAIIEFTKVSEDESGCIIKVTSFEGDDVNSDDEEMTPVEHLDKFMKKGGY